MIFLISMSLSFVSCQGSNGKCYNTGWSTSLNKYENKLTTLEADLVAAHGENPLYIAFILCVLLTIVWTNAALH